MKWNEALEAITAVHAEDGDIILLTGKKSVALMEKLVPILRERGLDHCIVMAAPKRSDLDARALNRDQMREAGWIHVEELVSSGSGAGMPFEDFYVKPEESMQYADKYAQRQVRD